MATGMQIRLDYYRSHKRNYSLQEVQCISDKARRTRALRFKVASVSVLHEVYIIS